MSNHLIDVHILHMPNENQDWWKSCEASLGGHPINIHNCNGIEGHIGLARKLAYEKGSAPYVAFVDPDDIVLPGGFQACLDVIEQSPDVCGVYSMSEVFTYDKDVPRLLHPYRTWSLMEMRLNTVEIHQLTVMRREDVMEFNEQIFPDIPVSNVMHNTAMFLAMADKKPWKAVDYVGYRWRNHPEGAHIKLQDSLDDRSKIFAYMNDIYYKNITTLY